MRWLLVKDLQILRRSPLLVGLLVVYPVAVALMIGFALSSPPGKPKVAYYSQIAPGHGKVRFGSQTINVSRYASALFKSIQPIRVHSRAQAIATVRNGQALAALIVPADITSQIESLVTQGVGSPTVELIVNSVNPLEQQFVQQTINSNLNQVEQAVSKQVLRVAISDLQEVLKGGTVNIGGTNVRLLGLRTSRSLIQGAITALPRGSAFRPALEQVVNFAGLAIQGLADWYAAHRPADPVERPDHALRLVRGHDRGCRVADAGHARARGQPAGRRALGEHLFAPCSWTGAARGPARGEGCPIRGGGGTARAADGRADLDVRAPRLGPV
jgi:hypothetical protein